MPQTRSGASTSQADTDVVGKTELKRQLARERAALQKQRNELDFLEDVEEGDLDRQAIKQQKNAIADRELTIEELNITLNEMSEVEIASSTALERPSAADAGIKQLLARQIIDGKLPEFDGDPLQWRTFRSRYDVTTAQLTLSAEENIGRLQNALRGAAKQHVGHLLHDAANLDEALAALERRFGDRMVALRYAMLNLDGAPTPDVAKPQTVIDFAAAVGRVWTTLAGAHDDHTMLKLEQKLSPELSTQWKMHCRLLQKACDFAALREWASELADDAWKTLAINGAVAKKVERFPSRGHVHAVQTQQRPRACFLCKGLGHFASGCELFKKLPIEQRLERVRQNNLCSNCLYAGHSVDACRSAAKCIIVGCGARHHPLLHAATNRPATNSLRLNVDCGYAPVLPVSVSGPYGIVSTYALIDSGSSVTFVDEDIAAVIGAFGPHRDIIMDGYFTKEQQVPATVVSIGIGAIGGGRQYELHKVLSAKVPLGSVSLDANAIKVAYPYAKNVPLESFSAEPKVLIGSAHSFATESLEIIARNAGEPRFYRSKLGWYVMGPRQGSSDGLASCYVQSVRSSDNLHEDVRKNILLDDLGVRERPRLLAVNEERAMELLRSTVNRTGPTSVEIGLLWRSDDVCLPDNYNSALMRLECLERKMSRDTRFSDAVKAKFAEYQEKGYLTKTNHAHGHIKNPRDWYIPIFGIFNKNKPGKIRLVADCAAETKGVSLNKELLPGPDLNNSIVGTLIRFRRYEYAAAADVEEMFHRVFIRPADRRAQRILWRDGDQSRAADEYEFNVMTFGATCSPASAQFVKNWNAEQHQGAYPEAASAIQRQFYVDDYLDSFRTVAEAAAIIKDVIFVQSRVRMRMTRWISNHPDILKELPETLLSSNPDKLVSGGESSYVLGLKWCRTRDALLVATRTPDAELGCRNEMPTKRQALAKVMSVYDPLGLASFVSARGKILLQEAWRAGINWDQQLPDNLREKWQNFFDARSALDDLPIPRAYSRFDISIARRELHVFCDASESAYAVAVYLRTELEGTIDSSLVYARSRVAPLKPVSIPRLELQAALLGARAADYVKEEMNLSFHRCVYWSDSTTAIAWITSETRKYTVYISNRVGEILDRTSRTDWRWVPTKENPADYATRCVAFEQDVHTWHNGPAFLQRDEGEWPTREETCTTETEVRVRVNVVQAKDEPVARINVKRFSRLERLLRVTACVRREFGSTGVITIAELEQALLHHVKAAQKKSFPEEISSIQRSKAAKGRLRRVEAFLADGFLRVRTRLINAEHLPYDTRFPLILDGRHDLTRLLIDNLHRRRGHQGVETVKNELRQRYYVVGVSSSIKAVIRQCAFCLVKRSQPTQPRMGDLPSVRMRRNVHPFQYTGLDYFGPFFVKLGRRREKRWGAIFTCLTVRAVHLEIVPSLSADSALQAIQRMSNRRGSPQVIYCDNGTSFHGADTELRLMRKQTASIAEARGIQFMYLPPYAPHMAGVWERMVRSVKTTLGGLLQEHVVTDETAYTVFTEVEWTLNSRPLTPVSADPSDDLPLTPNHFLLSWRSGAAGATLHPRETFDVDDADLYRRRQWRAAQRIADLFWDRWAKDYLTTIARRSKWTHDSPQLAEGDVVLLADPGAPRNEWRRGLVLRTYPGRDGIVRVADVRTAKGVLRRPATRLCRIAVGRQTETAAMRRINILQDRQDTATYLE